ncbi:hypothetical protein HK405_012304 [Cladochytrium tenue]|nr:hypothetical protein HK405_012304 [Cladochytrium tenue]
MSTRTATDNTSVEGTRGRPQWRTIPPGHPYHAGTGGTRPHIHAAKPPSARVGNRLDPHRHQQRRNHQPQSDDRDPRARLARPLSVTSSAPFVSGSHQSVSAPPRGTSADATPPPAPAPAPRPPPTLLDLPERDRLRIAGLVERCAEAQVGLAAAQAVRAGLEQERDALAAELACARERLAADGGEVGRLRARMAGLLESQRALAALADRRHFTAAVDTQRGGASSGGAVAGEDREAALVATPPRIPIPSPIVQLPVPSIADTDNDDDEPDPSLSIPLSSTLLNVDGDLERLLLLARQNELPDITLPPPSPVLARTIPTRRKPVLAGTAPPLPAPQPPLPPATATAHPPAPSPRRNLHSGSHEAVQSRRPATASIQPPPPAPPRVVNPGWPPGPQPRSATHEGTWSGRDVVADRVTSQKSSATTAAATARQPALHCHCHTACGSTGLSPQAPPSDSGGFAARRPPTQPAVAPAKIPPAHAAGTMLLSSSFSSSSSQSSSSRVSATPPALADLRPRDRSFLFSNDHSMARPLADLLLEIEEGAASAAAATRPLAPAVRRVNALDAVISVLNSCRR